MATTVTTPAPGSSIGLRSVADEVSFLAQYAEDVLRVPQPSADDKARLRTLVNQVRADLQVATDRLVSHLGGNPGDNEVHGH